MPFAGPKVEAIQLPFTMDEFVDQLGCIYPSAREAAQAIPALANQAKRHMEHRLARKNAAALSPKEQEALCNLDMFLDAFNNTGAVRFRVPRAKTEAGEQPIEVEDAETSPSA